MSDLCLPPGRPLVGRAAVPGDKSITHRALLLGALATGVSRIEAPLLGGDTRSTLSCLRALGVVVEEQAGAHPALVVHGCGLQGLCPPAGPLDCVRSGTTMRLLTGILAGQPFTSVLTGDPQLRRRPMGRVAEPLGQMGAAIQTSAGHAPLTIHGQKGQAGRPLRSGVHTLSVASAQVKSALLLAGLYADGPTTVREPGPARDHTERMLVAMGTRLEVQGPTITLHAPAALSPLRMRVSGDLSAAAFLLVAALLVPGSAVTIERVGLNPTRTGLLEVLRAMGAELAWEVEGEEGGEPVGWVTARTSRLHRTVVGSAPLVSGPSPASRSLGAASAQARLANADGATVVRMIDEFPILAVAATQAQGRTVVREAAELRLKETDRIATVAAELNKLGARIEVLPDGFTVEGPTPLRGTTVESHGDHRVAMALAVAGLVAEGRTVVQDTDCIADSFPGFSGWMAELREGPCEGPSQGPTSSETRT